MWRLRSKQMRKLTTLLLVIFMTINLAFGQTQKATTENGKAVILNPNGTWKYSAVNKPTSSEGSEFIGKWTEDNSEIFTISKIGNKFHFESNLLMDGAKTELDATLVNGELSGRPVDDMTKKNTTIKLSGAMLIVTNLYGNNKTLHKIK
jgi:hypothetical protein